MNSKTKQQTTFSPTFVSFTTEGLGGLIGWVGVHPFNTLSIRMSLGAAAGTINLKETNLVSFARDIVKKDGFMSLYKGIGAGLFRQLFYATSRLGFFEVFRDQLAKYREIDFAGRMFCGVTSGMVAAVISCPAEVTLVRMSNDAGLPVNQRRNYKNVFNAFYRIATEEGPPAFFNGVAPFTSRAALVGAVQIGTYDQFRQMYKGYGVENDYLNAFYSSMTSGLIYSVITMPFETSKNRMAFQKPDPVTGIKPYRTVVQTLQTIVKNEGTLRLWAGFEPYYLRCGGHTVLMFMSVEMLRKQINEYFD